VGIVNGKGLSTDVACNASSHVFEFRVDSKDVNGRL